MPRSCRPRRASGPSCTGARSTIRLHFDQTVTALPGSLRVLNGVGKNFAGPARVEGTELVAHVRPLPLGAYTVRWVAISADSHVVSGVWTFGVRVPAPAVTAAYGAGGPTRAGAHRALAVVRRARAHDRRARPAPDRAAGTRRPARRSSGGSPCSQARGRCSRCRPESPRSRSARRTRCSCRSGDSSTATSRRSRRHGSVVRSS